MDTNIVERIELLRRESGYSQALFARKCNLSPSNLNKMLHGTMTISEKTLLKIIKVFDVNYDWLRNGIGEMYRKDAEKANDQYAKLVSLLNDRVQANTINGNHNTGTQSINTADHSEVELLKQKIAMQEEMLKDKDKLITRLMNLLGGKLE